jgi:hypothetical protein
VLFHVVGVGELRCKRLRVEGALQLSRAGWGTVATGLVSASAAPVPTCCWMKNAASGPSRDERDAVAAFFASWQKKTPALPLRERSCGEMASERSPPCTGHEQRNCEPLGMASRLSICAISSIELFALNDSLEKPDLYRRGDVIKWMRGKVLAKGHLVGLYERS